MLPLNRLNGNKRERWQPAPPIDWQKQMQQSYRTTRSRKMMKFKMTIIEDAGWTEEKWSLFSNTQARNDAIG